MAPSNRKLVFEFIDSIPDEKLSGEDGIQSGTILTDDNFHFDTQGLTTAKDDEVQRYNLQVQVNRKPKKTSLHKKPKETVAMVLVPLGSKLTASEIKQKLKDDYLVRAGN